MNPSDQNLPKMYTPTYLESMVWSVLPANSVRQGMVLMHSHTAHMPQPTMCSPVVNSQQVAKLACIMLRNVTPRWIQTPDLDDQSPML